MKPPHRLPYVIEKHIGHTWLVVTGPWTDIVESAVQRQEAEILELNRARGFSEPDLEFLHEGLPIRALNLVLGFPDLSPLYRLGRQLEMLLLGDAQVLDLTRFQNLKTLAVDWNPVRDTLTSSQTLRDLHLWKFPERDLSFFAKHLGKLEELQLVEARSLASLDGLGSLRSLTALRILYGRSLRDISALGLAGERLQELEFQNCPHIESLNGVERVRSLRALGISACARIESLAPLQGLPVLEVLNAWGNTQIVDGDLSPVATLPRLKELHMENRRHYRPQVRDIAERLGRAERL